MTKQPAAEAAPAADVADPDLARAEVDRLNAFELKFAGLYREKLDELASVRASRGRQVLEAGDPTAIAGSVNARIRELEDELEAVAEAAGEARLARLKAIPELFLAQAVHREHEAGQLEAEADQLQAKSNELRVVLEKHDGCRYVPWQPTQAEVDNAGGVIRVPIPRHHQLRAEAAAMRHAAADLRRQQPHRAGSLEAESLEGLFAAVHADSMRVGPAVGEIGAWADQAAEELRRRRRRIDHGDGFVEADAPMGWHLQWRNGVIDSTQSKAFTLSAESGASDAFDSSAGFVDEAARPRIMDVEEVDLAGAEAVAQ